MATLLEVLEHLTFFHGVPAGDNSLRKLVTDLVLDSNSQWATLQGNVGTCQSDD